MNHSLSVSQTQTTVMCEMTLTGELKPWLIGQM